MNYLVTKPPGDQSKTPSGRRPRRGRREPWPPPPSTTKEPPSQPEGRQPLAPKPPQPVEDPPVSRRECPETPRPRQHAERRLARRRTFVTDEEARAKSPSGLMSACLSRCARCWRAVGGADATPSCTRTDDDEKVVLFGRPMFFSRRLSLLKERRVALTRFLVLCFLHQRESSCF